MSPTTLDVKLYAETSDDDILAFQFDDGEEKIFLNSDSCQEQMKMVFSKLIKLCLQYDVKLHLNIADDYGRGLYRDVCTEYVQQLQKELDDVKERIRREMAE